mmetsp:Transcript_19645/g.61790  ORF Transcript_19645/g.61790 Transcript_19645/m.61790 type:complete len:326 (-) Transcript_19645:128-1105(-)
MLGSRVGSRPRDGSDVDEGGPTASGDRRDVLGALHGLLRELVRLAASARGGVDGRARGDCRRQRGVRLPAATARAGRGVPSRRGRLRRAAADGRAELPLDGLRESHEPAGSPPLGPAGAPHLVGCLGQVVVLEARLLRSRRPLDSRSHALVRRVRLRRLGADPAPRAWPPQPRPPRAHALPRLQNAPRRLGRAPPRASGSQPPRLQRGRLGAQRHHRLPPPAGALPLCQALLQSQEVVPVQRQTRRRRPRQLDRRPRRQASRLASLRGLAPPCQPLCSSRPAALAQRVFFVLARPTPLPLRARPPPSRRRTPTRRAGGGAFFCLR